MTSASLRQTSFSSAWNRLLRAAAILLDVRGPPWPLTATSSCRLHHDQQGNLTTSGHLYIYGTELQREPGQANLDMMLQLIAPPCSLTMGTPWSRRPQSPFFPSFFPLSVFQNGEGGEELISCIYTLVLHGILSTFTHGTLLSVVGLSHLASRRLAAFRHRLRSAPSQSSNPATSPLACLSGDAPLRPMLT